MRSLHALWVRIGVLAFAASAASAAHAAPTEWWVVAARLDSGEHVFVEITLTDVGPGERNVAAIGNWIAKDGALTPFSRAKLEGDWTPSPDGKRIDLGKFVFDRSRPQAQLRVEKASLRLALEFPLAAVPLATKKLANGKWTQELWSAGAPVQVSFWKRGMAAPLVGKGRVALSHRWVVGAEGKLAERRLELFTLGAEPLYALEVASGKRAERWVVAFDARGKLLAEESATAFSLSLVASAAASCASGLPLASHATTQRSARLPFASSST